MDKVTIPVVMDADELWASVFGSAYETWSWWVNEEYADGADWETAGKVTLTIDDPESGENSGKTVSKTLTINDVVLAVAWAMGEGHIDSPDDMDAITADIVLQYAMFGEIIYG